MAYIELQKGEFSILMMVVGWCLIGVAAMVVPTGGSQVLLSFVGGLCLLVGAMFFNDVYNVVSIKV